MAGDSVKDQLIKAQEEYIEFLSDEYAPLAVFQSMRGNIVDQQIVQQGKDLRKKIEELKAKL